MRSNLPQAEYFIGKNVPGLPNYQIVEFVGDGCNALVFRAHSDKVNSDFACKIIPRTNLVGADQQPPLWKEEFWKANLLPGDSVVKFFDFGDWVDPDEGIDCVFLISQFIQGVSLKKFISLNKKKVNMTTVFSFASEMINVLNGMKNKGIKHGDLHTGNVLVEEKVDLLRPGLTFRVTDFGVALSTSDARFKDDYEQLAVMLRDMMSHVDYQQCTPKEKYIFDVINDEFLQRHLVEKDVTLDHLARNPEGLFKKLNGLESEFLEKQDLGIAKMTTPFDYLSCEQIGKNHTLLKALYSNLFLGLEQVESRNNLVLTGPRGCGKSTVFKSLSLKHRVVTSDDEPSNIHYLGIYFRCIDLYFGFPRYVAPNREEAMDIPIHYITCSLLKETLESVGLWAGKHFSDEFNAKSHDFCAKLWEVLNVKRDVPGANSFQAVVSYLDSECRRSIKKQTRVNDNSQEFKTPFFGSNILNACCELMVEKFSFLKGRPIFFLIDDYSAPKITIDLQKSLNRILMQRNSCCFFKLSTESTVSYARDDIDRKIYVENREFHLVNLGTRYLDASKSERMAFIDDVFKRRLSSVPNYPMGTLEDIIGMGSEVNHNETAREIRDGKKAKIYGKEGVCSLCSGDIHYILSLVGNMIDIVGGPDELSLSKTQPRISTSIQNKAVRMAAGSFLSNLRGVPNGEKLVKVVTAFGTVAHSFLKFRDSKNDASNPPHQASRIEPYEQLELCPEAQEIYNELLRYSVFIEDVRGKSRRGDSVPRLFLRRFLIPHFNLSFSTRDSVQVEPDEFERFLLNPDEFEKSRRLKSKKAEKAKDLNTPLPLEEEQNDVTD